jgi:hypothetical protein
VPPCTRHNARRVLFAQHDSGSCPIDHRPRDTDTLRAQNTQAKPRITKRVAQGQAVRGGRSGAHPLTRARVGGSEGPRCDVAMGCGLWGWGAGAGPWTRGRSGVRPAALKGQHIPAQGSALGKPAPPCPAPCRGATYGWAVGLAGRERVRSRGDGLTCGRTPARRGYGLWGWLVACASVHARSAHPVHRPHRGPPARAP